jgi:hypothetical protein
MPVVQWRDADNRAHLTERAGPAHPTPPSPGPTPDAHPSGPSSSPA